MHDGFKVRRYSKFTHNGKTYRFYVTDHFSKLVDPTGHCTIIPIDHHNALISHLSGKTDITDYMEAA